MFVLSDKQSKSGKFFNAMKQINHITFENPEGAKVWYVCLANYFLFQIFLCEACAQQQYRFLWSGSSCRVSDIQQQKTNNIRNYKKKGTTIQKPKRKGREIKQQQNRFTN